MNTHYRKFIAEKIVKNSTVLAHQWLESLKPIVLENTQDIFPTEQYLDHIPVMISEIGKIINENDEQIALFNSLIARKALELGNLRHEQNATVSQLIREYDLLAQHLETFVTRISSEYNGKLEATDMMFASNTIHSIVRQILQVTVDSFASRYVETIEEQTQRLVHYNSFLGHEIRSPLQTALLNIELILEDEKYHAAIGEELDDVKTAIEQIVSIMDSVEVLVKPSDPVVTDTPVTQAIDITGLLTDIAAQFDQSLADQQVHLQIPDDLGEVSTDTGKLRLILTNLLTNAIKYHDPDRTDSYVRVSREYHNDARTTITVEDNGIGISPEALAYVTDLKVRAYDETQTHRPVDGHGIGLYLVSEAVRFLGGEIAIKSAESVGTKVSITLPVPTDS